MLTLTQISPILQGKHSGNDISFNGVSIDTRTLNRGDLFIAIKGSSFNGHDFIKEAIAKGASAALVSEEINCEIPTLKVIDTRLALGQLAAFYRQQFKIPVVGLTGSCGKTTTKTMTANILQRCGETLATKGTKNNDFGVPLTLLELQPQHQFAVIEMGANHMGEIAYVTHITQPTVALITNTAPCHLEGFGDLPGVARAKGEIFQGLANDGIAIINIDDDFVDYWRKQIGQRKIITFGYRAGADIAAKEIKLDSESYASFELITPLGNCNIRLNIAGEHNVKNALAATAAAIAVGASLDAIKKGLEETVPVYQRSVIQKGWKGATIIDDSYNANPTSVKAAIELLANRSGEKILALGDMRELGPLANDYHSEIGRFAKQHHIDRLYAYGELSKATVAAFGEQGFHCDDQNQLIESLRDYITADSTVLVKGSLSTGMKNVVAALLQN